MSVHLMSDTNTEVSSSSNVVPKNRSKISPTAEPAAIAGSSTTPATDGNGACYSDGDYPASDTETEKPILLEIGTRSQQHNETVATKLTASTVTTAVSSVPYAAEYPLDMHLSGVNSYLTSTPYAEHSATLSTLTSHLALYHNPYTHQHPHLTHHHHHHHHHHQLPTVSSVTPINDIASIASYQSHIPQTVCAWPTADMDRRATPDVVPQAMYISYAGTREHIISKESNPVWKEKAMQIEKDYKKTACDRERTRMRDMNRAFDLLRSKLPISKPNGKKYSKIESLRIAINYINHLQQCLREDPPELQITTLTADALNNKIEDLSHSAVDYIMEIDAHRFRNTRHFEFRRKPYHQIDIDKDGDDHNRSSWSDQSYVPNGESWD